MVKRVRSKKGESGAIKFGGYALAGIAIALMLTKKDTQRAPPIILDYGGFGGWSFPQFDVPDWQFPYMGGVTGGVPNITIELPGDNQPIEFPALTGENNIVPDAVKTIEDTKQSTSNVLDDITKGAAILPFNILSGKLFPAEVAYDYVSTNFPTFLASDKSDLQKILTTGTIATIGTETSIIGLGLMKGGFNLGKTGTEQVLRPSVPRLISGQAIESAEIAGAKNIAKGAGLGTIGFIATTVGGAITLGETVGAAQSLKETSSPVSAAAFGYGVGQTAFLATQAAGAAGVGLPALGFGQALLAGNLVGGAVAAGAIVGLWADTALENAGILDPNRKGILDDFFNKPKANIPGNVIQDTQSMRINPGPIDGQAFGTPDLKLGDFEANTANLGPTPIYSSTAQSQPMNVSLGSTGGTAKYSTVISGGGGGAKILVKNSPLKPKPSAPINPAKVVFYGWSK